MKHEPLVSVIIPFLNAGQWLEEAVQSVIAQSYPHWELLLVDDGSREADTTLAKQFAHDHPGKIKYLEHEGHANKGVAVSRNKGIAAAQGDYIAFLDADDRWLPEKLANQLALFAQHPEVDMICEASTFWYSWREAEEEDHYYNVGAPAGVYNPPALMSKLYPLGYGAPPCPSGLILKKQTVDAVGGFSEEFAGVYQLYEDQAFLSKVYAVATVLVSEQANNVYRKRKDSVSSAANDAAIYQKVRMFYLHWLENYFRLTKEPLIHELIANFRRQLEAV